MKSAVSAWLIGLGLMLSHVGCCSFRMMDGGCASCGNGGGMTACSGGGMTACSDGDCGCGASVAPFGHLRQRIASGIQSTKCASGCGETYWDERINDPPVCDPCGCDGEYTGESCGSCPSALARLRNLWGYRYHPSSCGGCGSCSTCVGGGMSTGGVTSGCASCSQGSSHTMYDSHESIHSSTPSNQVAQPMRSESIPMRSEPTPATPINPKSSPTIKPMPTPDPSARQMRKPTSDQLVIGSGAVEISEPAKLSNVRSAKTQVVAGTTKNGRRLVTSPK
jgi:hypothetical protein